METAAALRAGGRSPQRFGEPRTVAGLPVRFAHPRPGQARRRCPGLRVGHRDPPRLQRQRVHGRARGHRERGVLRQGGRASCCDSCTPSGKASSTSTCACGPTGPRDRWPAAWRASARTTRAAARRTRTSGSPWCGCGQSAVTATSAAQVERLRDEMVYTAESIDLAELRELRARQVQEKTAPRHRRPGAARSAGPGDGLNAKFSPGALVDLEYAVQILQVMHGATETSGCARRGSTRRCTPWPPSASWRSRRRRSSWPRTASSAG